jgi:hypothetical protein
MKNKAHLSRVVELGCVVCGGPAEAHHIRDLSVRTGMGLKASDYDCIPLCAMHHRLGGYGIAYHAGPEIWEKTFGTQKAFLQLVKRELGINQ